MDDPVRRDAPRRAPGWRGSKDATSRMRSQTNRGFSCDIDYLNGYFVGRGRELGLKCPVNESVIWMVKARHRSAWPRSGPRSNSSGCGEETGDLPLCLSGL